ncbi:hypothetical protein CE91St46_26780 [Eubacteriales bacterium]|nr:N-terminal phage integrase SAM-like domain-containing protein [Faecalicatena sp. BF-R-105]GKH51567.1 hypothetical protein CE91St46_26780 [Eubacteriales bacterium]GKH64286.1 hypothetical protein CE91St47_27550 [Eubacteriales bacterium]
MRRNRRRAGSSAVSFAIPPVILGEELQEGEEKLLERSTWETYEIHVGCHIIPYFKDLNVKHSDLTQEKL